jgi:ferredoxin
MKVAVDPERCEGHTRCWDICPEVFALDAEGHAYVPVADVPPELEDRAQEAVLNCPERAITVS